MQGTESQPESALAKEQPEPSGFRHPWINHLSTLWAPLVVHVGESLPAMQEPQETWVRSLGGADLLEQGEAATSRILAWGIPWTEEPGGLQPLGLQRVGHDLVTVIHSPHPVGLLASGQPRFCLLQTGLTAKVKGRW